jgi:hypothetical protein
MSYGNIIPLREINEETILDKIGKHLLAGTLETMPADLQVIFARWENVLDCYERGRYVDYKGKSVLTPYNHRDLVKHLKDKFSISTSQAYEDIANAKYFHGLAKPRDDKEFGRGWLAEQIKRYIAICEHKELFKLIPAYLKVLVSVEGYDRTTPDDIDLTQIQPPELIIVDDPREATPNLPEVKNAEKLIKEFMRREKKEFIQSIIDDSEDAEEVDGTD